MPRADVPRRAGAVMTASADMGGTPSALAATFGAARAPAEPGRFEIVATAEGAYFALDDAARPVLIIPVAEGPILVGREAGGVSLHHDRVIHFRRGQTEWQSPAVVVTCMDQTLLPTFCVVALDVATRAGTEGAGKAGAPNARLVYSAMSDWERLFRARHPLSAEEELGLWGELWTLAGMANIDAAVLAWQGPARAPADFVFNGLALECKASTQRLRHHVSQSQLGRPYGDLPVFVASLWVASDPSGESLPDLVRRIATSVQDSTVFEAKLLAAGYSRLDAPSYRQRFVVAEPPLVFTEDAIPRVRTFDPGVSAIRFTVQLDDERALREDVAASLLMGPEHDRERG